VRGREAERRSLDREDYGRKKRIGGGGGRGRGRGGSGGSGR